MAGEFLKNIMWYMVLVLCIFLIVMAIVWFVFIPNPEKLPDLTWFFGWTILAIGIVGFVYAGFWKIKIHDKARTAFNDIQSVYKTYKPRQP